MPCCSGVYAHVADSAQLPVRMPLSRTLGAIMGKHQGLERAQSNMERGAAVCAFHSAVAGAAFGRCSHSRKATALNTIL